MGILTDAQTFDPAENVYDENDNKVTQNGSSSKKERRCHYSDVVGSCIVDAITGEKYPWRVGSENELRFFRHMNTVNNENPHRRTSRKAFYEDPHAFMRHRKIILDETIVNDWYDKIERLYPGRYTRPANITS